MEKVPLLKSQNLWMLIFNALAFLLVGAGAKVVDPEGVAEQLTKALFDQKAWVFGTALILNILLPAFKIWKSTDWRAAVRSTNFLISIVGVALWFLALTGIAIPDGAAENIVDLASNKEWANLGGYLWAAFGNSILHIFIKKQGDLPPVNPNKFAPMPGG